MWETNNFQHLIQFALKPESLTEWQRTSTGTLGGLGAVLDHGQLGMKQCITLSDINSVARIKAKLLESCWNETFTDPANFYY